MASRDFFKLTAGLKGKFVDRKAIQRAIAKSKKRPLVRWGALTRKIARQSIRKRKKSASPGKPPSSHSSEPNLRTIFFAWDFETETVPVGPIVTGSRITPKLPGVIQEGGVTRTRIGLRRGKSRVVETKVKPHPFMGPAMEKSQATAPDLFKDSIGP